MKNSNKYTVTNVNDAKDMEFHECEITSKHLLENNIDEVDDNIVTAMIKYACFNSHFQH